MSSLFFVLLFMSICFSLPQSNFLNGVGSEYEALLISLSLINKIEDFPLFPVTGSGVLGKSQEVQIILSQSPEVAVNDAAALQTRISQHHDFSCRAELVIRRHQATSALEKHYPTACQGLLQPVITAYRSQSSVYLGYSFPHHYMNSRCVLNHTKDGRHCYL